MLNTLNLILVKLFVTIMIPTKFLLYIPIVTRVNLVAREKLTTTDFSDKIKTEKVCRNTAKMGVKLG